MFHINSGGSEKKQHQKELNTVINTAFSLQSISANVLRKETHVSVYSADM